MELQPPPLAAAMAPEPTLASRWAWIICWLMFASTVLNYMDRQTVSLARPQIREAFQITTDAQFGWVLSAFIMVYALFQVPAGYLIDRFDLGWAYAAAVAWWSLAAVATAFAPTLGVLIACRALLGVGESFNWPCALRVTARILPPSARGLGNGIFNSGAAVGAVVTPLVVTSLSLKYGWRAAFLAVGSAGFVWVAVWLHAIRGPQRPLLTQPAAKPARHDLQDASAPWARYLGYIAVVAVACLFLGVAPWLGLSAVWLAIATMVMGSLVAAIATPLDPRLTPWALALGQIVRLKRFWLMATASVSINIGWHFLINWIPTFLKDDRGLDYQSSNLSSMIPFLAADLGNLVGGWACHRMAARGVGVTQARLVVLVVGSILCLAGPWVGAVHDRALVLVLLAVTAAGTASFMVVYFAFAQDVSSEHRGLVVGCLGAIGNLMVAGFQPFAGYVKDTTGGFAPIFWIVGFLPLVGLVCIWKTTRK